jgi:hypothetical protein
MKNLIEFIFSQKELQENPPVLMDIGASGSIHPEWKNIARYCISIAFDADDREMAFTEEATSEFRKLYVINRIVTATEQEEMPFYLTHSPYCSSLLKPDIEKLKTWAFTKLFEVEKVVSLNTITLLKAIRELQIKQIDWFKTDSQGIDLVLFQSLGKLSDSVIIAEFEPGIIDAYMGEDKLHELFRYMEKQSFWLNSLDVQGTQRINLEKLSMLSENQKEILISNTKTSACWANASYFNNFENANFVKRDFLVGIVFAIIQKQHAFAFELCVTGKNKFSDIIFEKIQTMLLEEIYQSNLPLIVPHEPRSFVQKIIHALLWRLQKLAK